MTAANRSRGPGRSRSRSCSRYTGCSLRFEGLSALQNKSQEKRFKGCCAAQVAGGACPAQGGRGRGKAQGRGGGRGKAQGRGRRRVPCTFTQPPAFFEVSRCWGKTRKGRKFVLSASATCCTLLQLALACLAHFSQVSVFSRVLRNAAMGRRHVVGQGSTVVSVLVRWFEKLPCPQDWPMVQRLSFDEPPTEMSCWTFPRSLSCDDGLLMVGQCRHGSYCCE